MRFLQEQLATVANKEVERNIKKLKQIRFEWADKLGKYLAWQLKKKRGQRVTSVIKERGEGQITDQESIRENFKNYYQKLYQEQVIELGEVKRYLERIPQVKIEENLYNGLNKPIEIKEIEEAIKQTNAGRSPETDGIFAKFYK